LLVFAVHTTPVLLLGGRIGVDLFFVLSGFLITSILLQEQRNTGSISLKNFYMRRVLRLYPALVTVVLFVIGYTWINQPEKLDLTLHNAVGVLAYFFNWQLVSEFPNFRNHQWMFSHVWSLSVEEQFYIVWPLIVIFTIKTRIRLYIIAAGILIPTISRFIAWQIEPSLSIYFRSDMRMDGMMWGALAALLIHENIVPSDKLKPYLSKATIAAVALLLTISSYDGMQGFLYEQGFLYVGFLSALLIYGTVVSPHPYLNKCLEFQPLRWVGKISYGLYIWHWPIIRAVGDLNLPPAYAMIIEFGLTFAIATLSFYFMEKWFLSLKNRFSSSHKVGVATC
jgi:peptidoglycan/LPS O-acetylase OafA/YrhL